MTAPDSRFQVRSTDLVAHAGHIDDIAKELAVARGAVETVRLDGGSYGQLCQLVPVLLNELQTRLVDAITAAEQSAVDASGSVRSIAASYDSADGNAADRLRNIR
jgi:hypothetical protein